jgi:LPXTG-motif cell wall-anchored protein
MDLARETVNHAKWTYRQRMEPSGEGVLVLVGLLAVMLGALWLARRRRNRRHPVRRRHPYED